MKAPDIFALFDEPQGRTQYCIADVLQRCPSVQTAKALGSIIRMNPVETKRLLRVMADSPHLHPFVRERCKTILAESDGRKGTVCKNHRYDVASSSFAHDRAALSLYIEKEEIELFDAQAREGAPQGRESKNSEPVVREGRSAKVTATPAEIVAQVWQGEGLTVDRKYVKAMNRKMKGRTDEAIREAAIRFAKDSNALYHARNPSALFVTSCLTYLDHARAQMPVGSWAVDYTRNRQSKGKGKGKDKGHTVPLPEVEQPTAIKTERKRVGPQDVPQLALWVRVMVGLLAVSENHEQHERQTLHELKEQMPKDCSPVYSAANGSLSLTHTRDAYAHECALVIEKSGLTMNDDAGKERDDWFGIMTVLSTEFSKAEQAEGVDHE